MNPRDPKVLFGVGVLGAFALLALTGSERNGAAAFVVPAIVPGPSTGPVKWTAHLSDEFFRIVDRLAADFRSKGARVVGEDFLGVLNAESGVSSQAKNRLSGCAGMNQICPTLKADVLSGLKGVGFTGSREEYLALSAEQQMPFVARWFTNAASGKYQALTNMGRLYLLNIAPAHATKPDDFPIYVKGRDGDAYTMNAGLDQEPKGFISVHDCDKFVHRSLANGPKGSKPFEYWSELQMRLNRVRQQGNV